MGANLDYPELNNWTGINFFTSNVLKLKVWKGSQRPLVLFLFILIARTWSHVSVKFCDDKTRVNDFDDDFVYDDQFHLESTFT